MTGVKFSDFEVGNELQVGDIVVGLRGGNNDQFAFPSDGIKDANGNYLLGWSSSGPGAVNYVMVSSSDSLDAVKIESTGPDSDIEIEVDPKGNAPISLNSDFVRIRNAIQRLGETDNEIIMNAGAQSYQIGGASITDLTAAGLRLGGANSRVNAILDEDNMASDSDTALATQQSIRAFLNSQAISPYIVGPAQTYTTIQAAINQAVADGAAFGNVLTVLVTNGIYIEDVAFAPFVNVVSLASGIPSSVEIQGACTYSPTGATDTLYLAGLRFVTNSASAALSISGAVGDVVVCQSCLFQGTSGPALENSNSALTLFIQTSSLAASTGQSALNLTAGSSFFIGGVSFYTDTPSLLSGTAVVNLVGGAHFNEFTLSGTASLAASNSTIFATSGGEPLNIGATAAAQVSFCTVTSLAGSGFWATGTGSLSFTSVGSNLAVAQTVDPALSLGATPAQSSSLDLVAQGSTLDLNSNFASNVLDPVLPQDAATKSYVDGLVSGGGWVWQVATLLVVPLVAGNAYIADNVAQVKFSLPVTAAVGDSFKIVGKGSGFFQITQNGGQTIHFGALSTTTGGGGSVDSLTQGDGITLVCSVANTDFIVQPGPIGTFDVI